MENYQSGMPQYPQAEMPQYPPMTPQAVPEELRNKWNWGAFAFSIWWGIGHKAYLTLLVLVPFLNLIWMIVCGIKGNEWAWKAGNYIDINHFKSVMAPWNRAGKICTIVMIVVFVLYFIFIILYIVLVVLAVGAS